MMKGLTESVADTIEPLSMLSLLARLGTTVDRDPELLLLRAGASRLLGRVDEAVSRHRPRRRAGDHRGATGPPPSGDRVGPGPPDRG